MLGLTRRDAGIVVACVSCLLLSFGFKAFGRAMSAAAWFAAGEREVPCPMPLLVWCFYCCEGCWVQGEANTLRSHGLPTLKQMWLTSAKLGTIKASTGTAVASSPELLYVAL